MSLDDMFRHPERTNLSDAQFEQLLVAREKEKRTRTGLIAFLSILGFAAVVVASIAVAIIVR
jgi:hypothetical protein